MAKRVLQISKYMYPFIGGVEQVVQDLAGAIAQTGAEQKIICFNEDVNDGISTYHKYETVVDTVDGIEVIRCGYQLKISSQSLSFNYGRELRKVMDDFKPDLVILHYPNPFVTAYLLRYAGRPFKLAVYWHLDITKQKVLKKVFHNQTVRLINRADVILGATPNHIKDSEYNKYFGNKGRALPYMVNEQKLMISEEEIRKAENIRNKYKGKVLGFFIGRHVPYKGLQYLIKASAQLKDVPVQFLIAGNGELTRELKELAKDDSKVTFLGRISDEDRRVYYQACDMICFPSVTKNEAFGLALAEGMYFSKPALTFTIEGSGVNYVNLNGVTGIESPNADSVALSEAIKKLVEDENMRLRYGENARERIQSMFTPKKFNENVQELLTDLLGD